MRRRRRRRAPPHPTQPFLLASSGCSPFAGLLSPSLPLPFVLFPTPSGGIVVERGFVERARGGGDGVLFDVRVLGEGTAAGMVVVDLACSGPAASLAATKHFFLSSLLSSGPP